MMKSLQSELAWIEMCCFYLNTDTNSMLSVCVFFNDLSVIGNSQRDQEVQEIQEVPVDHRR